MTSTDNKVAVLIVPYLAQSHLNMSFNLSNIISSYGIPVHYALSTQHLKQLKIRNPDHFNDDRHGNVIFHDFFVPSCDDLVNLFKVVHHLHGPVSDLIRQLSSSYNKVVVVHDALMASVVEHVKDVPNAESYTFNTVSIFSIFVNVWRAIPEKPFELDPPDTLPSFLPARSEACLPTEFASFIVDQWMLSFTIDAGTLYNGNRAVEGTYVRLLEKLYPMKKHFAVGPAVNKDFVLSHHKIDQNASSGVAAESKLSEKVHPSAKNRCLNWLDNQEKDSVIYISFGTTTSFLEKQIHEIATGLERSGQRFIWVLREADKGDIFKYVDNQQEDKVKKVLPEGFLDRVASKGVVVTTEWVPQLEILGHPSIGGFMTHCVWGSLTESMTMGVPVIACPMHSDQPLNSVLVTHVLKVGFLIRDDYWETRIQLTGADIIEKSVRRLMTTEEGVGMRKRAKDIGQAFAGAMAQGGASQSDMDSFIAHIT